MCGAASRASGHKKGVAMQEEEKPFGIKIIFLLALFGGILGLFESIFASDELIRNGVWNDEVLGLVGGFFNNIVFLRTLVAVFSIFSLWLASAVISLKRIGWYYLLFAMSLPLLIYLLLLIIVNVRHIPLDNMQKIGIAFRVIVNLCWLIYVVTVQSYFVH